MNGFHYCIEVTVKLCLERFQELATVRPVAKANDWLTDAIHCGDIINYLLFHWGNIILVNNIVLLEKDTLLVIKKSNVIVMEAN